jgi:hypothetical protein
MHSRKLALGCAGLFAAGAAVIGGIATASAGTPAPQVRPASVQDVRPAQLVHSEGHHGPSAAPAQPCTHPAAPGTEKVCGH